MNEWLTSCGLHPIKTNAAQPKSSSPAAMSAAPRRVLTCLARSNVSLVVVFASSITTAVVTLGTASLTCHSEVLQLEYES
jgi:hypothetical protein